MALNIKALKKDLEVTCPLFAERDKGDWSDLYNSDHTVTGAMMYTDSNGDTYGVITVEDEPGKFYLCGKVATGIIAAVCDPDNGGAFDEDGVMVEPFKIHVGVKTQGKDKSKSPYLPVNLIDESDNGGKAKTK